MSIGLFCSKKKKRHEKQGLTSLFSLFPSRLHKTFYPFPFYHPLMSISDSFSVTSVRLLRTLPEKAKNNVPGE